MEINAAALTLLNKHLTTVFNKAFAEAPSYYQKLAMIVPSNTGEEQYGWLKATPALREWVGDRIVHNLATEGFKLRNLEFEATVAIRRTAIEDDSYGIYSPILQQMGADAAQHPDKLILPLLKNGFTSLCYDGQNFFDTDHPVGGAGDEPVASVSNHGGGSGTAWFLLDCSQPVKPLVFQDRMRPALTPLTGETEENVFWRGEYVYGVRARSNAGYGLWQLAYGSKQPLDATNYAAARAAMMSVKKDNGQPRDIRPTHLVVPPSLEAAGLAVLKATQDAAGATNVWAGTAELIVSSLVA